MLIERKMIVEGPQVFYTDSLRTVLEDHMTWLREHPETKHVDVDATLAIRFAGDFFSLLNHHNVEVHLQWIVMRVNEMFSPMDSTAELRSFMNPSPQVISHIVQAHQSTNKLG